MLVELTHISLKLEHQFAWLLEQKQAELQTREMFVYQEDSLQIELIM